MQTSVCPVLRTKVRVPGGFRIGTNAGRINCSSIVPQKQCTPLALLISSPPTPGGGRLLPGASHNASYQNRKVSKVTLIFMRCGYIIAGEWFLFQRPIHRIAFAEVKPFTRNSTITFAKSYTGAYFCEWYFLLWEW